MLVIKNVKTEIYSFRFLFILLSTVNSLVCDPPGFFSMHVPRNIHIHIEMVTYFKKKKLKWNNGRYILQFAVLPTLLYHVYLSKNTAAIYLSLLF